MIEVVIIEDDEVTANMLLTMFKRVNITATWAKTGTAGYDLLQSQVPQVVILDVWLPGMDGLQLIAHMKSDPRLQHIHIIVVTADGLRIPTEDILSAGADHVLLKPFEAHQLRDYVLAQLSL